MPLIDFDRLETNDLVADSYSDARGPIYRGEGIEVARVRYPAGGGARPHQHPEEQVMLILSGRLRVTINNEAFEVRPGQAFHAPSQALHSVEALEDIIGVSFKRRA